MVARSDARPSDGGQYEWPYPLKWNEQRLVDGIDVLVLGGGVAGCWAAIGAARSGAKVALVEKGATLTSGASGSGCDHWESAATNPCSRVTPEELTQAMLDDNDGYNNGISHYIECREGYDRVVDIEQMGAKVRDVDGEFEGAEFRDEETKLLFAYDYHNKFSLRVWGTTFKPALYRELRRAGVQIFDRTMACGLLTEGGEEGARVVGGYGIGTRTGAGRFRSQSDRARHVAADALVALHRRSSRPLRVPTAAVHWRWSRHELPGGRRVRDDGKIRAGRVVR